MESVGLVPFDETWGKELRHKKPSIADDEFSTPWNNYYSIIDFTKRLFGIVPLLDVFATHENSKCTYEITKEENAFVTDWILKDGTIVDVWWNNPHSDHPRSLWRSEQQYQKYDMNIVGIIPANVMRTGYYHEIVEKNRYTYHNQDGHIHLYPYWETITFEKNGKKTKDSSRNAYQILVWLSKKKLRQTF